MCVCMCVCVSVVYAPMVTTMVQFRSQRTEHWLRFAQVTFGQFSVTVLLFSPVSDYSSNQAVRSTICILYNTKTGRQ